MSQNSFDFNWDFSEEHLDKVIEILNSKLNILIKITRASFEEDTKYSTDLVVKVGGKSIAVRVRRPNIKFRDVTIRAWSNGHKTEIDKLREGFGDYYFYGWTKKNGSIDYVILDINKMREHNLFNSDRKIIMNPDKKTGFVAYPLKLLNRLGCIIDTNMSNL